jgi:hypothetical protein
MPSNEPRLDQLRDLVSRSCQENPNLTSRLEKAAFLTLLRPIQTLGEDTITSVERMDCAATRS